MRDTRTPLSMSAVEKKFRDSDNVLDGVDLVLKPGSITGLLGRNGSGKTTLIRTAIGLLKAQEGEVKLFGYDAWECPADIRRRVGYVAQQFDDMLWLRVDDALKLVGSFYESWDYDLVDRLRDQWNVPTGQVIQKLSIGQQQKVGILLAIGHLPALLVLDEPVASLDPVARQEFLRALLMLNDEIGQTILFSSHITTDIERVAADVAILHEGKITYHGQLDELKEQVQCLFLRADTDKQIVDSMEGVISSRADGNRLQVWVRDWNEEKNEMLNSKLQSLADQSDDNRGILLVEPENVGLEELFMGMTS